jgi:protein-tyrosine-phosphatase
MKKNENDIGQTIFSPGYSLDYEGEWKLLEQLQKLNLVFCFCDGNAFRSRVGKLMLNRNGVPAISAAVGDITKQHNKRFPPPSTLSFLSDAGSPQGELRMFRAEPMRMASELMVACAAHILAYCPADHLKHLIDLSDPRLHLLYTPDPVTPRDYRQTYDQVVRCTADFFHKHYPDRSAAMTIKTPTSAIISQRIATEMRKLNFSIVPSSWGNPLTSFDALSNELL